MMLQRNHVVLWREFDGESVLLHPTPGCSYNLNRVGTIVWKMLDGQHGTEDIAQALCEIYEVEIERALRDVKRLLADLQSNNLIVNAAPTRLENIHDHAQ